jgi:nitric oxide reductase subunit C
MSEFQKGAIAIILFASFLAYSIYLYAKLPMQTAYMSPQADEGKMVWQKKNCTACHQLYGLGGFLGPDLTNEYSFRGPEQTRALIQAGNSTMPAYPMTEEEITCLLAYLQHVDQTGISDPKSFKIQLDGTIRK